jgi:hypothetical protein
MATLDRMWRGDIAELETITVAWSLFVVTSRHRKETIHLQPVVK